MINIFNAYYEMFEKKTVGKKSQIVDSLFSIYMNSLFLYKFIGIDVKQRIKIIHFEVIHVCEVTLNFM
jgi:hypothetical protein